MAWYFGHAGLQADRPVQPFAEVHDARPQVRALRLVDSAIQDLRRGGIAASGSPRRPDPVRLRFEAGLADQPAAYVGVIVGAQEAHLPAPVSLELRRLPLQSRHAEQRLRRLRSRPVDRCQFRSSARMRIGGLGAIADGNRPGRSRSGCRAPPGRDPSSARSRWSCSHRRERRRSRR